jgi:O-antigen biosynthesis protein
MNDDIRVISKDWLDQMVGMIQRDGVGAVGPKLLFPNGTIQHAGVVLLGGLPGHVYYEWPKDAAGYAMGAKVDRNYLAVTGACTITPKWLFDKLGGYSSKYPLNYNDVDYCLRLHRLGYRSVYLANVELYHYEGVSKEGGRSVSDAEVQLFLDDWSSIYSSDPYYNINLSQNAPYQFG